MFRLYRKIALLLASCLPAVCFGSSPNTDILSSADGLSGNVVYAVAQDSIGYMWFGTDNGLDRYDGKIIKTYRHIPGNENSMSNSQINCLLVSSSGKLYVGTRHGLNVYHPETDCVVPFAADSLNGQNIRIMAEEEEALWIGTNEGLFRVDARSDAVSCYHAGNSGLAHNIVRAICIDNDYMFIGTFDGVSRFNRRTGTWRNVNLKPASVRQPQNNLVLSMEVSPYDSNILLVGTQTGLCELNKNTLQYTRHDRANDASMINNTIKTICTVNDKLWLGTEEGLMIYDGTTFENPATHASPSQLLSNTVIWDIRRDRGNIIWIATENGIARYDTGIPDFRMVDFPKTHADYHAGMSIFAAQCDSQGCIWLGSRFGVSVYDPVKNRLRRLDLPGAVEGTYNFVKGLCMDDNDILWIGTAEGLICYDTRTGREERIQEHLKHRLKYIYAVRQDSHGDIYASDASGRLQIVKFQFDSATRRFTSFSDRVVLVGEAVEDMSVGDQYVWLGSAGNGVVRFDKATGEMHRYLSDAANDSSLSSNYILSVYVSPDSGQCWVGTDKGIDRYDAQKNCFVRVSAKELPGAVYAVCEDKSGLLWLSTSQSVVCYDHLNNSFRSFPKRAWLSKRNGHITVAMPYGDDVCMFVTDGYLQVNHRDFKPESVSAPLCLTDVRIMNRSIKDYGQLKGPLERLQSIRLSHTQNVVAFCFSMLDYAAPSLIRYYYKLDGYDEQWRMTEGATPYVEYDKLHPGHYTFQVSAVNNKGVKAVNTVSLEIDILPPWWNTVYAYLVYLLLLALVALVAWSIIRNRRRIENELQTAKLEREKLEEINQLKLWFFTNVSHDFRTPLSLIISPVETLLGEETDPDKLRKLNIVNQNAQRLVRLVNQILDFRKIETQKMALRCASADIVAALRGVSAPFAEMMAKKDIAFIFESNEERLVMDFDADKIDKIFFNLLSNAVKFTREGGQILVNVQRKDMDRLEIVVADNGIGIPHGDMPHIFERFYQVEEHMAQGFKSTGIGLVIVKEFVELHGGLVEVKSSVIKGTTFIVTLPIVNALPGEADGVDDSGADAPGEPDGEANGNTAAEVILVEDNEDMRIYLQEELSKFYRVTAVANAESALRAINENIPDIVISDIMLPKMDGVELCRRIKSEFLTSHIPVILLTAKTADEQIIEGYEAGADEYICKPFKLKLLLSRIENIILQRQKLRDILRRDTIDIASVDRQSPDEEFICQFVSLIEENMSDPELNIPFMCDRLAVSHINCYRKIKAITGLNVNAFIRDVRLRKAAQLLRIKGMSVTEVMYEVGFNHRSYFSMCFREKFGITPKTYAQQYNQDIE